MPDATGEGQELPLRVAFDRRIKLEFHGAVAHCPSSVDFNVEPIIRYCTVLFIEPFVDAVERVRRESCAGLPACQVPRLCRRIGVAGPETLLERILV